MTTRPAHSLFRRALATLLAGLLGIGPLSPAYGATTPLADEPLNISTTAKPNIALTVDDSTSMLFDFLPDYVATSLFCRDGTGAAKSVCGSLGAANDFTGVQGGKYFSPGYIFQQFNAPYQSFNSNYGKSGPGAGCYPGAPPTCSEGIDPGTTPGIGVYPAGPQPTWPNSGKPYEYWLFWPAPVHNAAVNALYYDPLLTYEPPVDDAGKSFKQMDAGNTNTWTEVPADPWATPVVKVDLTLPVNLGLWCNSDWSLGSSTDTKVCRVNGSGAPGFGSVPAEDGQDYTYPWAPVGFTAAASGPKDPLLGTFVPVTQTYAAQKVTLDAKLFGTGITAAWTANSGAAKDPKYFYENENVIWCDPTSPSWPQVPNSVPQTCVNLQKQGCNAIAQTCTKTPGGCTGYIAPSCNGLKQGTCSGWAGSVCNGTAGACPGGAGANCAFGMCQNPIGQVCNGTPQTCATSPQTCSGPQPQVCNLPGTQTCQPQVCSSSYVPSGCNLLPPDPENPCVLVTSCLPAVCTPNPGTCSIQTTKSCTQNADCTAQPGICNVTLSSCMQQSDCLDAGKCSVTQNVCTNVSVCPIQGGTCSKTGKACVASGDCPATGDCSNDSTRTCISSLDCGKCTNPVNQTCTSNAQCSASNGTCNQATCPNGTTACTSTANCGGLACTAKSCTSAAGCPAVAGGTCAQGGAVCGANANCPTTSGICNGPGICSGQNQPAWCGQVCNGSTQANANAQCQTAGTCNNPPNAACTANPGSCPEVMGTCDKGPTVQCRSSSDCSSIGTCSISSAACNSQVPCLNVPGICDKTSLVCTTPGIDPVCVDVGTCSVTGLVCTVNADCPAQSAPLPPSAGTCSTGGVGGVGTATLRNDADNNGVVCRRNNKASGTYTSGAYDYPSGKFLTPITNGTGVDACPATPHWQAAPRHYWKVSVEWCDTWIAIADDKWLNYGTRTNGTCQPFRDGTHVYPRFYPFGGVPGTDAQPARRTVAAFTRVDLDINNQGASYNHGLDADGNPVIRTFAQEMTNYANWFAYYRTRIQAVKTVTSLAFTLLNTRHRVGFHTLSNGVGSGPTQTGPSDPAKFVDIQDFDATQKAKWWKELFAIGIPLQMDTPNLDAMMRIGEWFKTGTPGKLVGATDPIILSCQKNWHMLFTDGFTSQVALPTTTVSDQDDTIPVYPDYDPLNPIGIPVLIPGQPWPWLFREDPNGQASDAASDYAMNYWVTDLRTTGANAVNNVGTSCVDPAAWQHLNFAAMSLGTQGKLPAGNQSVTETSLATGTLRWPQPYPKVYRPDASGVDDLWHAAKNGRGRFVNADSADELKLGMGQILQDVTNQSGARAGAGFQSSVVSSVNKWVYRAKFEPGWGGSLAKVEIDPKTGGEVKIDWEASAQLSAQLLPTIADPQPWLTQRRVVTMDDSAKAVPFLWGNLSGPQQDSLAPTKPLKGQKVLAWLRGDASNEGTKLGQLRVRSSCTLGENFLGDIVDSRPVYVGAPKAPYLDSNDPGYSNFKSTFASRKPMVYVGANEGMMHAIDDANGGESWAYIPHPLYRPDNTGLGALAYQDGALPPFRHHFYVDSTLRAIDTNLDVVNGDWRTLLVGGLGKGGQSYYAIDVTDPGAVKDELTAAQQVLWEFTDTELGSTFGTPMITKSHAFGGRWLVIVPSGYNNASGEGIVFFIDASNGKLLHQMTTGVGSPGTPAGLAHIAGYTKDYQNQMVEQIYGGDLYGHFWRFDVSDPDETKWTVREMAYLTDKTNGQPQPVTTAPQIEIDLNNGVDRWVFVGTGRLLDDTDLASTQGQTLYAIRDGTANAPKEFCPGSASCSATLVPRTDLVGLVNLLDGLSSKPVNGWYHDLPAGQRIITPIQAAISVIAYVGTSPQTDPCLTGEPATLYARQFADGYSLLLDPKDPTGATRIDSIYSSEGGVGIEIVNFADNNSSQSGPDLRIGVTLGTTGQVIFFKIKKPDIFSAHRMSWRLLGQ